MAREFSEKNPGTNTFSIQFFRSKFRISSHKVATILEFYQKRGRIFFKLSKEDGLDVITLNCPKLKELTDNWTERKLRSNSEVTIKPTTESLHPPIIEVEVEVDKRKNLKTENFPPEIHALYNFFLSTLSNGQASFKPKNENQKLKWLDALDKCHRLNKYEFWKIADIIQDRRENEFWFKNFYTPLKLRRKNKEGILYIDYFYNDITVSENLYPPKNKPDLAYIKELTENMNNA